MKKKAYQFYNDVYFQPFFFLPNWTREEIINVFKYDPEEGAQGMAFTTSDGIFIWIKDFTNENMGYLCHEAVHAANILFQQRGQKISTKNDEAQAYMVQWIFDNCRKSIKRRRK